MELISQLVIYSKPQQALKGEIIYDLGDFAEEMAFITRGNVRLVSREGLEDALVGYASTGDFFGDFELYKRSTRVCRYEATYNCKLFTIGYNRFLEAMDENEKSRKKLVLRLKRRYDQFVKAKESALLKGYMDDEVKSTLTNEQRRKASTVHLLVEAAGLMLGFGRPKVPVSSGSSRQGRQESMQFMRTHVLIFEKAWINGETEDIFEAGDKVRTAAVAGLKLVKRIGLVEKVSYNFVVWDYKHKAEGVEEHTLDYLEGTGGGVEQDCNLTHSPTSPTHPPPHS
jgi:CRP-like cAMP-binding protein